MRSQTNIPTRPQPIGAVGPGSQPGEADGSQLDYLPMPGAMQTYRPPVLPEPRTVAGLTAGLSLLESLRVLLSGYRVGALPQVMDLQTLDAANLRLIEDSLGEGEVSIKRTGPESAGAQETRLAGVWRVRVTGADGVLRRDVLEVCDIPGLVRYQAFVAARDWVELPQALPDGIMNAPGIIAELNDRVAARLGKAAPPSAHVINLTLLPQTEQDVSLLNALLGTGPVSILSRGYGNCRITATKLRDVWWVQYFNSDDRLILNTLEVTDVPAAALAAQEDIDDSALRLHEILQALQ
jgi:hydrogenase-1 operon protein HyaF